MEGVIKYRVLERGYGFITGDDGNSYFLHISRITGHNGTYPEIGQRVKFTAEETAKGLIAVNAVLVGKDGKNHGCE